MALGYRVRALRVEGKLGRGLRHKGLWDLSPDAYETRSVHFRKSGATLFCGVLKIQIVLFRVLY